ncbi:uncharacterized protein At5g19025-like [Rosa rugosa]|uniref:uncharacterized protein At5g19025-like n=1 Tax=Rosa rugosa TaxID=74645 RepID=UPI002B4169CC|nr:uncharacterized protein At5g19025-like [Rosa rugosa]XP_062005993.1 uncharacterized protein At5g19025-like [Rosa rugosa]XP_062014752.1 uncharacterized protein At5g19025-like [Rosa rugosa]XP_062014765.1 uncharacterized protein At5g19025-like [Rosa rugosa]
MAFPTRTSGSLRHVILLFLLIPYLLGFLFFFVAALLFVEFCCGARSRKCDCHGCKGLKKAMEFDLQLQNEECVKTGSKEIDKLPWKGGSDTNPNYECLRSELRKMAPPSCFFEHGVGAPSPSLKAGVPSEAAGIRSDFSNFTLKCNCFCFWNLFVCED